MTPVASVNLTTAAQAEEQPNSTVIQLKETVNPHSEALLALRECCNTLVDSQKQMTLDITQMNDGINKRFADFSVHMDDMTEAIGNLKHSPTRTGMKMRKAHHPA